MRILTDDRKLDGIIYYDYPVYRNDELLCYYKFTDLQSMVNNHTLEDNFQIGDLLVVPWIDPVTKHKFDCPFIIGNIRNDYIDANGNFRYGIAFESLYSLTTSETTGVVFDSPTSGGRSDWRTYGWPRWVFSNLRQYMNAKGSNWFVKSNGYDNPPYNYVSWVGMLDTFPRDMVSTISPIKNKTRTNYYDGNTVDITIDTFYLLSSYEKNYSNSAYSSDMVGNGVEAPAPWNYYSNLNNGALFTSRSGGSAMIKYRIDDHSVATNHWTRSCLISSSCTVNTFFIWNDGTLSTHSNAGPCNLYGYCPAFSILDNDENNFYKSLCHYDDDNDLLKDEYGHQWYSVGNVKLDNGKFGGGSLRLNYNGTSYVYTEHDNGSDLLTSGKFTIDFWCYFYSINGDYTSLWTAYRNWSKDYTGFSLSLASNRFTAWISSNGSNWNIASGTYFGTATTNTWYHVATVRDDTSIRCYLNGVLGCTIGLDKMVELYHANTRFVLGACSYNGSNLLLLNGLIDEFRIVKGKALYDSNFDVPDTPYSK